MTRPIGNAVQPGDFPVPFWRQKISTDVEPGVVRERILEASLPPIGVIREHGITSEHDDLREDDDVRERAIVLALY